MVIRIGMISFAHIHAHSYAACLKMIPGEAELAGIFDEDLTRGRSIANELNVTFFDSCDALLQQDIQGVIICAENVNHKVYTQKAAEAGKHVLCEKPISVSISDAQSMIDTCHNHNVQLMIAFPCRYNTAIFKAHQLVTSGKLGNILGLKGTNRGIMPDGWFIDKSLSGGGAIMDHTVHVVDVWRWMLKQEIVSVYAESGQLFNPSANIDDAGLLALEFQDGVFASLDTSWSRPKAAFPAWGDVTMEIVGDQGSLTIDAFNQKINIYNNDAVKAEWACFTDNIDLGLIRAFVKMTRNGETSPITGYDGLKAMEVALGAYRSIKAGKPVPLPLQ